MIRRIAGHLTAHLAQSILEQVGGRVQGLKLGHDVDEQLIDDEAARMDLVEREAESESLEPGCVMPERSTCGVCATPVIKLEWGHWVHTNPNEEYESGGHWATPWPFHTSPVAKGATEPAREVEATPDKPTSRAQTCTCGPDHTVTFDRGRDRWICELCDLPVKLSAWRGNVRVPQTSPSADGWQQHADNTGEAASVVHQPPGSDAGRQTSWLLNKAAFLIDGIASIEELDPDLTRQLRARAADLRHLGN